MNKKKLTALVASLGLVACIGVGATLAYFTDSANTENTVTMGHVNIDLSEPIFSSENEGNAISNVMPNQRITKDPTILVKQDSQPAYIRAKIDIPELKGEAEEELLKGININSRWVKGENDYYYFQNIVNPGEEVKFFTKVTIPSTWNNDYVNKKFQINVTAEAIQADNFEPNRNDLNEISGWNGVNAETYTGPEFKN